MQTVHSGEIADIVANGAPGATKLAQFFIPAAASLQERRPRILKHGDTFGLFDHNGDALAGAGSPDGLYHLDTRYLSFFSLTINGERPMLLSSTPRDDNAALIFDLTNPDLYDAEGRACSSTTSSIFGACASFGTADATSGWRCAITTSSRVVSASA